MNQIKIDLYPAQGRFVGTVKHFAAFVAGIGSGKTWAGAVRGLLASQGMIGKRQALRAPNLGVVTAPTYRMLMDATLRTYQELAGPLWAGFNKAEMRAVLANGSEILFRSTDNPEHLRGPSISWWHGDEAALYTPETYPIMVGRLRQFGQFGYAWLTTTPKGRNFVYKEFAEGRPDHLLVQASSGDNPHLARELLRAWDDLYVGEFAAQELQGQFVAFQGLIYPEFEQRLHTGVRPADAGPFVRVIAGVDWGVANPGIILVAGVDSDGRIWLLHEEYERQRRIEDWVTRAKQLRDDYKIDLFIADPSEPDNIKKFKASGCKTEPADNRVLPGIQSVKARLYRQADGRPRLMIHPSAVWTIAEFEQYAWAKNMHGLRDEPIKANDHCMDALRYLVMEAERAGRASRVVTEATRYM